MKLMVRLLFTLALVSISAPAFAGNAVKWFHVMGAGFITSISPDACPGLACRLTITAAGTAEVKGIGSGSFASTLTVLLGAAGPNGGGGVCAPASGSATLAVNGSEVTLAQVGTFCDVNDLSTGGSVGPLVGHTLDGTYFVLSGSGRFRNARGAGSLTVGGDGYVLVTADGTLVTPNED